MLTVLYLNLTIIKLKMLLVWIFVPAAILHAVVGCDCVQLRSWFATPPITIPNIREAIKGTQAWNFFLTFFAKTETSWSQGPVTQDFWKSYSIRPLLNISAHAQHAMKSVPSILSMRWNSFRVCSVWNKILCGFKDVYMTESHYSLGMVTRSWSTLYLQWQFLIYTILHCAYSGNVWSSPMTSA